MELNPAAPWAHAGLGSAYLLEGKFEEAVSAAQGDAAEWARLLIVACARWSQKQIPEADAALAQLIKDFGGNGGIPDRRRATRIAGTRTRLSNGWSARAGNVTPACPVCAKIRYLANLHDDPRWNAFLRTMGLADDQLKMSAR